MDGGQKEQRKRVLRDRWKDRERERLCCCYGTVWGKSKQRQTERQRQV